MVLGLTGLCNLFVTKHISVKLLTNIFELQEAAAEAFKVYAKALGPEHRKVWHNFNSAQVRTS